MTLHQIIIVCVVVAAFVLLLRFALKIVFALLPLVALVFLIKLFFPAAFNTIIKYCESGYSSVVRIVEMNSA